MIGGFQNTINKYLSYFFVIDNKLFCKDYIVKFVISLTILINKCISPDTSQAITHTLLYFLST